MTVERLANKHPASMCHPCDMDAPIQDGTRWDRPDFHWVSLASPELSNLFSFGESKSPLGA